MPGNRSRDNWGTLSEETRAALIAGGVTAILFPTVLPFEWWVNFLAGMGASAVASVVAYSVVRKRRDK